jgi:GT2 family glycosyltransferase
MSNGFDGHSASAATSPRKNVDSYTVSALQAGLVQRDNEIQALRSKLAETELFMAEYREYQRLVDSDLAFSATAAQGSSKLRELFYHLAHRGFFKSGQPAAKVLGLFERVYQRLFKRPSGLFEHHNFDEQFFLGWNPAAATYPGGPFQDYLTNWYPSPRQAFPLGEVVHLLMSLRTLASSCSSLRGEGDGAPKVSIVIPVYNQLRVTLKCIRSVLAAGALEPFEIIVVDDCSAASVSDVLSKVGGIRHLRQAVNGGFIASCNAGASIARGEYLVFLNNDTHVLAGWLDELLKTFVIRPKTGLVGSQLIYPNGVLQEAGAIMWRDGSGWNYGRGQKRDLPQFNYLRPVDWCSGASIMIPRALFSKLGRFDPLYSPAYAEDVDLAFKVRKSGYEVLYQPCSKVVHFEGVSSGTDTSTGVKAYQVVNLKKLYERWQPTLATHGISGVRPDLERDRGITKRILFMDAVTPTPDCDAGSVVVYQFMKIFLKLGYGVSFIPVDNLLSDGKYTQDLQRIGVECWHYPFISSVDEYLQKHGNKFDLIFMYRAPEAAKHLDAVRMHAPQAKIVFNTVDLHFVRAERQAEVEGSVLRRVQAAALKEKELHVMRSTEATILLNKSEVDLIKELAPSVKTFMLPLTQEVPGSRKAFAERKDMVFIGGFRHLPNVDAVKYFCSEVMPLVRMQLPGVKFVVVGSHVPDELHEYASEDVEIRGFVADLADVFDHCRISVAPLRFGAGMKGKIVTSLTYGVPCVTTTIGSEGMGLTEGENVLLADDPASYAQAIVDVYTAESTWGKLSKAGIDFAKQNFSPEVVEQQIRQMMGELGV